MNGCLLSWCFIALIVYHEDHLGTSDTLQTFITFKACVDLTKRGTASSAGAKTTWQRGLWQREMLWSVWWWIVSGSKKCIRCAIKRLSHFDRPVQYGGGDPLGRAAWSDSLAKRISFPAALQSQWTMTAYFQIIKYSAATSLCTSPLDQSDAV